MEQGRFITFEGGEGTGKSTHAATLAQRLRGLGRDVVQTREPGGSPGAEIMRHVLLSGAARAFGPDAEALLFAAARDDHLNVTIRPALARGAWVVCDRFADSTRIYQGLAGAADSRTVRALERIVVGPTAPDLTIILDVPAAQAMERAAQRRGTGQADRFEAEDIAFHERLREGFVMLASQEPQRCVLVDATRPKEEVAQAIWQTVEQRLMPGAVPPAQAARAAPQEAQEAQEGGGS